MLLLINWDRFPVLWENQGNFRNVLLKSGTEKPLVVAIDQGVNGIDKNKFASGYTKYTCKIKAFVKGIMDDSTHPTQEIKHFMALIKTYIGVDIGDKAGLAIQKGFTDTAKSLCGLKKEELRKMRQTVIKEVQVDWADVWKKSMANVNVDFIWDIIELLQPLLNT